MGIIKHFTDRFKREFETEAVFNELRLLNIQRKEIQDRTDESFRKRTIELKMLYDIDRLLELRYGNE